MRYDINFNPMPNKAHLVVLSEAHLAVLRSFLKKPCIEVVFSLKKIKDFFLVNSEFYTNHLFAALSVRY